MLSERDNGVVTLFNGACVFVAVRLPCDIDCRMGGVFVVVGEFESRISVSVLWETCDTFVTDLLRVGEFVATADHDRGSGSVRVNATVGVCMNVLVVDRVIEEIVRGNAFVTVSENEFEDDNVSVGDSENVFDSDRKTDGDVVIDCVCVNEFIDVMLTDALRRTVVCGGEFTAFHAAKVHGVDDN